MLVVTTSYDPTAKVKQKAINLAVSLAVPYVERNRLSLEQLMGQYRTESILIVSKQGLRYENRESESFYFHPNLSVLRLKQWTKGENDAMVQTAKLSEGDHILDCTLGMGSDAIVASFVAGATGKVVGLESQPIIAQIVKDGLQYYQSGQSSIDEAMRRIEVIQCNYQTFLQQCESDTYDVVLFDPMFRKTIYASSAMQMLKPLANPAPVDEISVQHALRVARRCVMLKERKNSKEFERLGFAIAYRTSSYAWGMLQK